MSRPEPTDAPVSLDPIPRDTFPPIVERGTGVLTGRPPSDVSRASITTEEDGEVTLNVVDANLREVVRLVLEETLDVNYVIDPAVDGTITVQTSRPVPRQDLIAILDAVLRLNGAALVEAAGFYKVVPIDQALTSGLIPDVRPVPDARRPGFAVEVVAVRYIGAAQVAELLAPFAPPGGTVQVDEQRNLLLLAGAREQLTSLRDLIAIFDVDWLEGMSVGLFPLQFADAERLVGELDAIFGGTQEGPLAGVVRLVPVERLGAILVVSTQPAYLDRARTWIQRLDQSGEGDEEQVYVYRVQNGRARDLAEVLSQLFDLQTAEVGEPSLLAPGLEPVEIPSTRGGFAGREPGEEGLEPSPAQGEREPGLAREPLPGQSGQLGTGTARDPFDLGTGTGRDPFGLGTPTSGTRGQARIIADDTTNSLVIRATPRDYRRIQAALQQLDILPLQVLIEATIAEVTLRDQLRYGVEWFFRFGGQQALLRGFTDTNLAPRVPGFSAIFTGGDDVRVVINALEEVSDVNVISSPQLLVLDNQTAQIQVGDEVPILTQQAQSTETDARIVNSIEQRPTGIILSVTPRVNASGVVIMEIQQEVSAVVSTSTGQIDSPTISQRRVASTVSVQSGETVALGGLIQDNINTTRGGVPVLHRLPIVGPLFGQTFDEGERTELLVMITPRVIRNPQQARSVTQELRQRMRAIESLDERVR